MSASDSRRVFLSRLLGASTAAAALPLFPTDLRAPWPPLPMLSGPPDETYWERVRAEFLFPAGQIPMNSANMSPASRGVVDALVKATRDVDGDVSYQNRARFDELKERVRPRLATLLGAGPDEIAIVRNASEANNIIVGGLALGNGDEVVLLDQNHPTNNVAWDVRAARFGFTVRRVGFPRPPASADEVVTTLAGALSERTRVLAFSEISNSTGLQVPAQPLCRLARARGIHVHIDGAQTCGVLEQRLTDMGCDSYAASAQKWLMGPREAGLLYVRAERIPEVWPGVIGSGWGPTAEPSVKGARKFEMMGQRNDAILEALSAALDLHERIGIAVIERRVRELVARLAEGLSQAPALEFVTPVPAELRLGVLVVKLPPETARAAHERLYRTHAVITSPTGGLRFSPHVSVTLADMDRAVRAVRQVLRSA